MEPKPNPKDGNKDEVLTPMSVALFTTHALDLSKEPGQANELVML